MMYYIDRPATWRAVNKKCELLHDYVDQFRNCLVADDLSRDALVEEIRHKVEELNQAYPRTKRLMVVYRNNFLACSPEGSGADYIFSMHMLPVRRTYRFSEPATTAIQEVITVRNVCHAPITDREALPAGSPFFAGLEEALAHGIEMSVSNGGELTPVAFHWEQPDGQHSQCCTAEVAAEVLQAIIDKLKKGGRA